MEAEGVDTRKNTGRVFNSDETPKLDHKDWKRKVKGVPRCVRRAQLTNECEQSPGPFLSFGS
jgi:hypothetical protein